MSPRVGVLLALLAFLVVVVARLPAAALSHFLPAGVQCSAPSGTVWQGSCEQVQAQGVTLSSVQWILHPASLLRLRLAADIETHDPRLTGRGAVEIDRSGALNLSSVTATLPLQSGLTPFPAGWSGTLQLALDRATLINGRPTLLVGTIDIQSLQMPNPPTTLGSYELRFAPVSGDAPVTGQLRDLDGPLSLSGELQLQGGGGYQLQGLVAAHAGAPDNLAQLLDVLGPADPQGRHMFAINGTF